MFIFQQQSSSSTPYVIIAAAISAAVSLAGTVLGWAKDRNSVARRSQIIDEATKYLAFWTAVRDAEQATCDDVRKAALIIEYEKRIVLAKRLVDLKATYLPRPDSPQYRKWKALAYITAFTLFLTSSILFVQHWLRKAGFTGFDEDSTSFARDPVYRTAAILSILAGGVLLVWVGFKYYRNRRIARLTIDQWVATQSSSAPPQIESSDD